jgi:hypothetical protein
MANPIEILEQGGIPASSFPESVRDVLAQLTEDEARALVSVQNKVNEASDEVTGYAYFAKPTAEGALQFGTPVALRPGLNIGDTGALPKPGGEMDPLADKGGVFW